MPDLQRVLPDYDPLDQQLQDPLPLGQRRLIEPRPHPLAERLRSDQTAFAVWRSDLQSLLLVTLGRSGHAVAPWICSRRLLQLVQVDHLGLVGVEQPLLLAVEPPQLGLPPLDRGMAVVPRLRQPGPAPRTVRPASPGLRAAP